MIWTPSSKFGAFDRPLNAQSFCPLPWQPGTDPMRRDRPGPVSADTGLFHDGSAESALLLSAAKGQLCLEIGAFDGSYISLAVTLPDPMAAALGPSHSLRLTCDLGDHGGQPRPGSGSLRLAVQEVGGLEPAYLILPFDPGQPRIDLPLGPGPDLPLPPGRAKRRAWIDVIFTDPAKTAVILENLRVTLGPTPIL